MLISYLPANEYWLGNEHLTFPGSLSRAMDTIGGATTARERVTRKGESGTTSVPLSGESRLNDRSIDR